MPLSFPQLILVTLGIVMCMMLLMWLLSVLRRNASIVDPFWGFGFVVIAWCTMLLLERHAPRAWLLATLVSIWGLRLSGYLLWRSWGEPEDRRYRAMREKRAAQFWWFSLISVFVLQGVIMWVVSLTCQAGMFFGTTVRLGWLDVVGVVVWSVGLFFESVGDYQMARFKSAPENQGKVMDQGLWHLTRHPNYFGDFCVWWGLYLVAVAAGGWWTFPGPLLMSVLLMKVSGVTLLESDIGDRRPDYQAYKQRTSAFFPRPPAGLRDPSEST